jgi:hypothetical protein
MRRLAMLLLFAAFAAAAQKGPSVADLPAGDVDVSVFLIGDAGMRKPNTLLPLLQEAVDARIALLGASRVAVIFLGDNEYSEGTDPAKPTAIIQRQVTAADRHPDTPVLFVAGNHDWAGGAKKGLSHVLAQQDLVRAEGGANVVLLPGNGCPGPAIRDLGTRLRVIALDSQWWLHRVKNRPANCGTETSVEIAITDAVAAADQRQVIVVAHHPLRSGGQHGTTSDSVQDQNNATNKRMREAFTRAISAADKKPLAWVSGHEHTLEVQQGIGARFLLVAGAGRSTQNTPVARARESAWLFPKDPAWVPPGGGFMRLDITKDGSPARVAMFESKNKKLVEIGSLRLP